MAIEYKVYRDSVLLGNKCLSSHLKVRRDMWSLIRWPERDLDLSRYPIQKQILNLPQLINVALLMLFDTNEGTSMRWTSNLV